MGKQWSRLSLALALALLALTGLAGCGGHGSGLQGEVPPPAGETPAPAADLPAPSELREAQVVTSGVFRYGSQFEAVLPHQRVTVQGDALRFTSSQPYSGLVGAAYAIYAFDSTGYVTDNQVQLLWQEEVSGTDTWIALANYSHDRWDWFAAPQTGATRYDPAVYSHNGHVLVVVLYRGSRSRVLQLVSIGPVAPPIVSAVSPPACYQNSPVRFSAQVAGSVESYSWDFGGGATPGTATDKSPIVTAGAAGEYSCSLIVRNGSGQDAFTFTLKIAPPAQWPMEGHDARNTRCSEYVGSQTGKLKWSLHLPGQAFWFTDAVTANDGTIYVGVGTELRALNPDGSVKWYSVPCFPVSKPALAADGTIYVASNDYLNVYYPRAVNGLYALNPDGSLKWFYPLPETTWAIPVVAPDGNIYIGCDDGNLYAISADGSLTWSFAAGSVVRGAPAVGDDGTLYMAVSGKLYALKPDGSQEWLIYGPYGAGGSIPAIGLNGTIYLAGGSTKVYAISSEGNLQWVYETGGLINADPIVNNEGVIFIGCDDNKLYALYPGGSLKWAFETGYYVRSTPVFDLSGNVYFGSEDSKIYAVHSNGTLYWSLATGDRIDRNPVRNMDGKVLIGSWDGLFYAVYPSGALAWTHDAGCPIYGSPVVGTDGTVYLHTREMCSISPDGQLIWTSLHDYYVYATPGLGADGTIYIGNYSGFYALNSDGSPKWKFGDSAQSSSSPVIGLDGVICVGQVYIAKTAMTCAFWPNGNVMWSSKTYNVNRAASVLADGTVYLGNGPLVSLSEDGSLNWESQNRSFASVTAVATDGTIYVPGSDQALYAYQPDGSVKWSLPSIYPAGGPAIAPDGTVYLSSTDGKMYAISPAGSVLWDYPGGESTSPTIGADGTVYFGSRDAKVYALDPAGGLKWLYETDSGISSSAAIAADGTVYVGSGDGKLYAFGD